MWTDHLATEAYVNHGRWVARCPFPACTNAEVFGRCQDDSIGGLRQEYFHCREDKGGCGIRCSAIWPDNIPDIEDLVKVRPVPGTRNWIPGETVEQLWAENVQHGLVPLSSVDLEDPRESRPLIQFDNGRIVGGSISNRPRLGIEGG